MSAPPKRWRCFAIRRRNGSARWPRRWADWTRWFLPAASARMRRRFARAFAAGLNFLASNWMKQRNAAERRIISTERRPGHRAGHPHRRGMDHRQNRLPHSWRLYEAKGIIMNENQSNETTAIVARPAAKDGCLLARRQLSVGRPDLSLRQSAAEAAAGARGYKAHAAGTLGHDARAEFHLRRT